MNFAIATATVVDPSASHAMEAAALEKLLDAHFVLLHAHGNSLWVQGRELLKWMISAYPYFGNPHMVT